MTSPRTGSVDAGTIRPPIGHVALIAESVALEPLITSWNPDAEALYGWAARDVVGNPVSALFTPSSAKTEAALRRLVRAGEHVQSIRLDRRHANGGVVPVLVTMSPIADEEGVVTGLISHSRSADERDSPHTVPTERFRSVVDALDIGVIVKQVSPMKVLYANRAAFLIPGFDPDQPWPDVGPATITHPADRESVAARVASAAEGRGSGRRELRLIRPDGSVRWVLATTTVLPDASGITSQLVSTLEDISSLKAVETALTDSQQRFDEMASAIEIGFMLRNVHSERFLYVSPAVSRIFGLESIDGSLTVDDLRSLHHPDDAERVKSALLRAETGLYTSVEARIIRSDHRLRWLRINFGPVLDDGSVVRIGATFEDVTAQHEVDRQLRASQELFVQTAEALEVGVSLRDIDSGRFLYVNRSYIELVGFDPTIEVQAPVESALSRIHPDDRESVLAGYWTTTQQGMPAHAELRIIEPSGEIRWLSITSHPVDRDGLAPRLAAGTLEDITSRKNAEASVNSAREEALKANRAKSEFLSRMSHELRTPLNAVLGFAQLLNIEALSESQQQAVSYILHGGQHLLDLINDLLDISRIDTDQINLDSVPVVVGEVIHEVIGLMSPEAAIGEVQIDYLSAPADVERAVLTDRRRLKQVLLNLVSNAIKYNRLGGRVEISCRPEGESQYAIAVRDTGIGIPEQQLHKVFQPFERLGQRSSHVEGTGIGLALSNRLMLMMQGRIEFESTEDVGSTFTAILPRANYMSLSEPQINPRGGDRTMLLLCVDDKQSNVDLIKAVLRSRPQWTLIQAIDGASGIQLATTHRPTLVMLDLHLPDMNGIEVLDTLTSHPVTRLTPVVVVSADASPEELSRSRQAGARQCIAKPFTISDVLQVLDSYAESA